jgi:hypothetical protein
MLRQDEAPRLLQIGTEPCSLSHPWPQKDSKTLAATKIHCTSSIVQSGFVSHFYEEILSASPNSVVSLAAIACCNDESGDDEYASRKKKMDIKQLGIEDVYLFYPIYPRLS